MSDLLIRDLDDEVKRRLNRQARRNGRSLSAEAQAILQQALMRDIPEPPLGSAMAGLFADAGYADFDAGKGKA